MAEERNTPAAPTAYGRTLHIVLTLVIAAAFTGFLVGVRQPVRPERPPEHAPVPDAAPGSVVLPAVDYSERPVEKLGPNRDWEATLESLTRPEIDLRVAPDRTPEEREAAKARTLELRRERRAFGGAPPMSPHPIEQQSSAGCLACHGRPTVVSGRNVPQMSHEPHVSCTQCHVEAASRSFPQRPGMAPSEFAGMAEPQAGARAWAGAPPVIPHATSMRVNCLACHGPAGRAGLETTHPERVSCMQCHAPSAALDQYASLPPGPATRRLR